MNLVDTARELVDRARAGDQNAMAIISLVGENARSEGPSKLKAKIAYAALKKEINRGKTEIGEDERLPFPPPPFLEGLSEPLSFYPCLARAIGYRRGFISCVVAIANGPELTQAHMGAIMANVEESGPSDKGKREAIHVLRHAGRIQRVRKGGNVGLVSRDAAWELGE
jgi:hypothetical protein